MERKNRRSEDRASLHIDVEGDRTISSQARTYAEYRVFAALTRAAGTRNARSARVVLRHVDLDSEYSEVACLVTVRFDANTVRVRAFGAHAYAAINGAVERLRAAPHADSAERIPS
jgi:ribosome-associated translation inhibitor RaiA